MDLQAPSDVPPPGELQPPGVSPDEAAAAPRRNIWFWVLLVLLLVLALAVVFALPSFLVPTQQAVAPVPPSSPAQAQPPSPVTDTMVLRNEVQQILESYLQLRARLELAHAVDWGEPDWSGSSMLATKGDRFFAQRQFAAAGREYQLALDQLRQLEANRGVMLASALEQGAGALAADDVVAAVEAFEVALKIEPGHPDAVAGIARAQRRGSAITQMNLGLAAEANGDLDAALAAYTKATELDTSYAVAATALARLSAEMDARDFNLAMSAVLNALDSGKTEMAAKALTDAERLRPDDPAVRDARLRLQAMRAQAGLNRLRRQVTARVREEDWPGAVSLYRKALGIDSSAAFASTGLQHAEQRVRLHQQFDHYLDKPSRLYADAPLANAEKLLAAAGGAPGDEPRLTAKIGRLSQLVLAARTPLRVTLKSDGQTHVVVYRVARLGTLETHQLDLRPGDYTIVGSRAGYRDVRKVIRVRPGKPPPPMLIRCEETI